MNNIPHKSTWHFHIKGQVQGVGFRPYIYLIAQRYGLVGWVKNDTDGLHIEVTATKKEVEVLRNTISKNAPSLARITSILITKKAKKDFTTFQIIHHNDSPETNLLFTPDVSLCKDCISELLDPDDRRTAYPFISCSQCGPRYSIIHNLPYDRINTKMDDFILCQSCLEEYSNPSDRRYYAQTNSCSKCAIRLSLFDKDEKLISSNSSQIINQVNQYWKQGQIVAIKGIGGYLITCDATNKSVVERLRIIKNRPSKPLAVMYPNIDSLQSFKLKKEEIEALTQHVSPIVLIPFSKHHNIPEGICERHDHIGVMIPYAPLFKVLLEKYGLPIVATSANMANNPISFRDGNIFEELSEIVDYILINNREIVTPQDDSVLKFTHENRQIIIHRRSRGLAPTYIQPDFLWTNHSIISTGAQLKSTFSILHKGNVFVSQYLGDLDNYNTTLNFTSTITHLTQLLNVKPDLIISDQHLEYESTKHGIERSKNWGIPIYYVQHHLAHFSAILGEHNLTEEKESVLGVIWDGSGLGSDGHMWGSEFFVYKNHNFTRCTHLSYFDLILGDKMAKEPRLSALSFGFSVKEARDILRSKFTDTEWRNYIRIFQKSGHYKTSSMGRLFDAVSSILGILDRQTFEGEAAMLLEVMARKFFKESRVKSTQYNYDWDTSMKTFSGHNLLKLIISDLAAGLSKGLIAYKFHYTLVLWIRSIAMNEKCNIIAFSGGVFQNSLLVDLLINNLGKGYKLCFHKQLSPNDENISFGQLIYHQIEQRGAKNA